MCDMGPLIRDRFNPLAYHEAAASDLEKYISYHREAGSRLVSDEELDRMRTLLQQQRPR
jgi:hypothetical protein